MNADFDTDLNVTQSPARWNFHLFFLSTQIKGRINTFLRPNDPQYKWEKRERGMINLPLFSMASFFTEKRLCEHESFIDYIVIQHLSMYIHSPYGEL